MLGMKTALPGAHGPTDRSPRWLLPEGPGRTQGPTLVVQRWKLLTCDGAEPPLVGQPLDPQRRPFVDTWPCTQAQTRGYTRVQGLRSGRRADLSQGWVKRRAEHTFSH